LEAITWWQKFEHQWNKMKEHLEKTFKEAFVQYKANEALYKQWL
jgi:hypothetical protein